MGFEKDAEICSYVQDFYSKVVREYGAITSFDKHAGKNGAQIVLDLVSESNVAVLVDDNSVAPDYYNLNKKYELKNSIIPFKIINNEINCKYENAWSADIIKLYNKIKEDLSKDVDTFNKYAELAKKLDGEIISFDSMQIYKGMHIASAAPDKEEMQGVPHHLLEFLENDTNFSVADFIRALYSSTLTSPAHTPQHCFICL